VMTATWQIAMAAHHANLMCAATTEFVLHRRSSVTTATRRAEMNALPHVKLKHVATAW